MLESRLIWENVPPTVRLRLETNSRVLKFKRGDLIYQAGHPSQGLYFIENGLVGLTLIGPSGKEHLLRFFRTGQFFGHRSLFADEPFNGSAIAIEPSTLRFVHKKDILAVLDEEPGLYKFVVRDLAQQLRRSEAQHVMVLENKILPRTAQALVYLKDLYSEHNWTRQEIANFCASTTSTIIKALAELEKKGFIRQQGRSIEILDRKGLIALGF